MIAMSRAERAYLHAAGQSETKGTQTVFNAWNRNTPGCTPS